MFAPPLYPPTATSPKVTIGESLNSTRPLLRRSLVLMLIFVNTDPPPSGSTKRTPNKFGTPNYINDDKLQARITEFVGSLASRMERSYDFIRCRHFWQPPEGVDEATRDYYNHLQIPLFDGKPSLLLHGLGQESSPSPFTEALFKGRRFK